MLLLPSVVVLMRKGALMPAEKFANLSPLSYFLSRPKAKFLNLSLISERRLDCGKVGCMGGNSVLETLDAVGDTCYVIPGEDSRDSSF